MLGVKLGKTGNTYLTHW